MEQEKTVQRTYRFKTFLENRFHEPVRKLPVHTYLGCPHRDSTGRGGCAFCYNPAFSTLDKERVSVETQIRRSIRNARQRGYEGKFLAYFQTGTNTYGRVQDLERMWGTIRDFPGDIVGLAIGTRPDCLPDPVVRLLADMAEQTMVWVELGLQSAQDRTLERIRRGHDAACFREAAERLHAHPRLLLSAHVILGLPGEDFRDMKDTILEVNRSRMHGIKIHHLQIVRHTLMETWYKEGQVEVMEAEAYVRLAAELLTWLDPAVCIHRFFGETRPDLLVAPRWNLPKARILQRIEAVMEQKGWVQGCRLAGEPLS